MSAKPVHLLLAIVPALALGACSSEREAELEQQLAEAKQSALEEAAARKAAERDAMAARARDRDAALQDFYSGQSNDGGVPAEDLPPAPADDGPPPDPTQPQVAMPAAGLPVASAGDAASAGI